MEPRTIYLVRHGHVAGPRGERRYLGQLDLPLSAQGERQAHALARHFLGATLGGIWCSDLARTRATAAIVGEAVGRVPVPLAALREVSMGRWEGRTFREVAEREPEAYQARGFDLLHHRAPGGESFADCAERAVAAFEELVEGSQGDLLVVGHAGVNRLLLCHVLGMPPEHLFRLAQDHACLNVLELGGAGWRVRLVNGRGRASGR